MAYIHTIYRDIADILDHNYDHDLLSQKLSNKNYDWEFLVKVGSKQLVLPAIYCNLKSKDLLQCLPEELQAYLEEITTINRNRNKTIHKEAESIALLFKANNIDYVFLKGTALLISGYYKDLGERMIGDIDILVHPDQLFTAQNLLLEKGYSEATMFLKDKYFSQRHLSRLITDTKLAAVEIHRRLLLKSLKHTLEPLQVLKNKQIVNGVTICSTQDLLIHTVLNFQVNDHGYYYNYLDMRNAYDALIISEKLSEPELKKLVSKKYLRSFFDKMNVYFNLDDHNNKSILRYLNTQFFVLKQKNKYLSKTSYFILNFIKMIGLIFNRIFVFLVNPEYRKDSLKDYKRIIKLLKKGLFPFMIL